MISLLLTLLVLCIVGGLIFYLVGMLPIPAPFGQAVKVIVILIFILILLGVVFGGIDVPRLRM